MSYIRTEWVDGENKYSLRDSDGNVIPGFEDIKIIYEGTTGTPLSSEKMNNIEQGIFESNSKSLQQDAIQNVLLWQLEAGLIQTIESMDGWQGDAFLKNQDEVAADSLVVISRKADRDEGHVGFGKPKADAFNHLETTTSNSGVKSVAYSPDGVHLAVGGNAQNPYLRVFKRDKDKLTLLSNPEVYPDGQANCVEFSPDGAYLACAHSVSSYLKIYKRTGDSFSNTGIALNAPSNNCFALSWSPDSVYLAVGFVTTSPYIAIYKRSGGTFTKLTNPVAPAGNVYGLSFSPDGVYLACANFNNCLTIYKRSGDTFTKIATINGMSSYTGGYCVKWSPDGIHLVVGHAGAPYFSVLKRDGDVFTRLPDPAVVPDPANQSVQSLCFSPDGNYLLVGTNAGGKGVMVYRKDGDILTNLPSTGIESAESIASIAFSPNGMYVAVGCGSANLPHYKAVGVAPTTMSGYLTLKAKALPQISNTVFLMDKAELSAGVSRSYSVSLNGGVDWEDVIVGESKILGHSGNSLVVRLNYEREVLGVGDGKVFWVIAWAGVS